MRSGATYATMVEDYNFFMQPLVNIPRLMKKRIGDILASSKLVLLVKGDYVL